MAHGPSHGEFGTLQSQVGYADRAVGYAPDPACTGTRYDASQQAPARRTPPSFPWFRQLVGVPRKPLETPIRPGPRAKGVCHQALLIASSHERWHHLRR
jgi:hypothetical protein